MATAQTIVNDALQEIGVLAEGETASATMADNALRALNRIMGLLSNDKSFAYSDTAISLALTGQTSFTVGATGDLAADRPIRIDSAYVIRDGITYPVEVIGSDKWDEIPYKATTGSVPEVIYYNATMVNGIVYPYPVSTGCTLYLRTSSLVTSFATLGTALSMPPGYEEYLIKALAVNISPQYPAGVLSKLTQLAAINALKVIKRTNKQIPRLSIDPALNGGGTSGLAAIYRG